MRDIFSCLVSRLTLDIADCIEATWAVGIGRVGGYLLPVTVMGDKPDIDASLRRAEAIFEGAASETLVDDRAAPIACVIRVHESVAGVIVFGSKRCGAAYTAEDRMTIDNFIAPVGLLMSNNRVAERALAGMQALEQTEAALRTAREVQNRFFPRRLPLIDGLDFYGECRPAGAVGSDFFDFVGARDALLLSIGNVSGEGVAAAIIMAGLQASLRAAAVTGQGSILETVRDLNRVVHDLSCDDFFASMFYGLIDTPNQKLHFVNAGHEPPMLLRADSVRCSRLVTTGTVLGLSERSRYEQKTIRFHKGDVLVASTADLDEHAVVRAVREHEDASSSDLTSYILEAAASREDHDRTVLVVRFDGPAVEVVMTPAQAYCTAVA